MRLVACVTVALVACSTVETQIQDASVDAPLTDASSQDATVDVGDAGDCGSACPVAPPTANTPCSVSAAATCEYGDAARVGCDTLAQCTLGVWQLTPPSDSGCTNPSACPLTFDASPQACASEFRCDYLEGVCACTTDEDGGLSWQCAGSGPGCPAERPRFGTPCTPGQRCGYGRACSPLMGEGMECDCNAWAAEPVPPCPPP